MTSATAHKWTLAEAQDDAALIIKCGIIPTHVEQERGLLLIKPFSMSFMLGEYNFGLQFPHEDVASRLKSYQSIILCEEGIGGRCWVMETHSG